MPAESVSFDIAAHDHASPAFREVGRSVADMAAKMDIGARQARVLAESLDKQRNAALASTGATVALAKADQLLADAEHALTEGALEADFALKKQADAAKDAARAGKDAAGGFSGFGQAVKSLFTGNWAGLTKTFSSLPSTLAGIAAAGPAAAIALGAIAAAVTATASVAVPAVIGLASLAAFAFPVFSKLTAGYTAVTTAQKALTTATTEAAKDTALAKLAAAWKNMSPAQAAATRNMISLRNEFTKLANALAPDIFRLFNLGLKTADVLLPDVFRIAKATLPEVAAFLERLSKDAQSPAFQQWLGMMARDAPKALAFLGKAIFDLTDAFIFIVRWFGRISTDEFNWAKNTIKWFGDTSGKIGRFFTIDIPAAFAIFQLEAQRTWEHVEIGALRMVQIILDGMSHIPLIGRPFKAAADAIGRELARIEGDVRHTTAEINAEFAKIHGHHVTLDISGRTIFPGARHAAGTPAAAPGWALVGEEGAELVRMRGGETVLPHPLTRRMLRGYAGGAGLGLDFSEVWTPPVGVIDARIAAGAAAMEKAIEAVALKQLTRAFAQVGSGLGGGFSASALTAQAFARSLFPAHGWSLATQWPPLLALWNRESGWSATAQNAQSGAAGIPQDISGNFHGGYQGQVIWGENYIAGRYGNPVAAWIHEGGFGWYDRGGYLPPGLSLAWNGTGRPEPVGGGVNIGVVHIHMPPGSDGASIVNALQKYARRNGPIKLPVHS